jgi:hypothetical protein
LWSPRRSSYDVQVGEAYLTQPLPGDYGGLGVSSGRTIEQSEGSLLRNVRVDVGAVQSFLVEGYAPAAHVQSELVMTLDSGGSLRVEGEVLNTSGIDLEDAVILAAGAAQDIGDLSDGEQASVNVSLLTGYASAASSGGIQLGPGFGGGAPYYGGYDSTVDDIMGSSYCYGTPETERRCSLLQSVVDPYSGAAGRGAGVYLVGWVDEVPLDVSVLEGNSSHVDMAVYFFALPVTVEQVGQTVTVPPSLMTWTPLDDGTGFYESSSPYDIYLSPMMDAPIGFRFEPLSVVSFGNVTGLTVHVDGYQSDSMPPPHVELWDWSAGEWERMQIKWGDTDIPDPTRYVGATGAVQLRIWVDNTSQGLSLDRVDVTLEGTPSN